MSCPYKNNLLSPKMRNPYRANVNTSDSAYTTQIGRVVPIDIVHVRSSSAFTAPPPSDTDFTYKRETTYENADQAHVKRALYVC